MLHVEINICPGVSFYMKTQESLQVIILDYYWYVYIHVKILYVYVLNCSCRKHISLPLCFRALCDSAIREMNEDKFFNETENDSDVSM